jgi:hypothetical protein
LRPPVQNILTNATYVYLTIDKPFIELIISTVVFHRQSDLPSRRFCASLKTVKPFTAILFSLLLILTPFASLRAATVCPMAKATPVCCHQTCHMACCEQKKSNPQPAPAAPSPNNGAQNQISLLALKAIVLTLPEKTADTISAASVSPLLATATPLYTRHCALLL